MRSVAARVCCAALLLGAAATPGFASPRRTKTPVPPTASPTVPPAPTAAAPRPGALVPDQPYVGTPSAGEKPYLAIVRAKEAGATDAELLSRIEKGGVRYSLSTPEIQQLRAAGVSPKVIEAMLRSGRTPVPAPTKASAQPGRENAPVTPTLSPR
jgi:hypothetical protein